MKLLFGFIFCATLFSSSGFAQFGRQRIETRLAADSTIFTMTLNQRHPLKPGESFQARIHVKPGSAWHVYSSKMSNADGLTPLTIVVPHPISDYFEITKITETGAIHKSYDSNFMAVTMAHYKPFDLIATVKVLKKSSKEVPFYLYVHFQTCTETMCMPPRTFEVPMTVLGKKPLNLKIAQATIPHGPASGLANVMKSR